MYRPALPPVKHIWTQRKTRKDKPTSFYRFSILHLAHFPIVSAASPTHARPQEFKRVFELTSIHRATASVYRCLHTFSFLAPPGRSIDGRIWPCMDLGAHGWAPVAPLSLKPPVHLVRSPLLPSNARLLDIQKSTKNQSSHHPTLPLVNPINWGGHLRGLPGILYRNTLQKTKCKATKSQIACRTCDLGETIKH